MMPELRRTRIAHLANGIILIAALTAIGPDLLTGQTVEYDVRMGLVLDFEQLRPLIDQCADLGLLEEVRSTLEAATDLEKYRDALEKLGPVVLRGCPPGVSGSGISISGISEDVDSTTSQQCEIPGLADPNINASINPRMNAEINPKISYNINPTITYSINPRITYRYNPRVTYSINPNVTTRLNPYIGQWSGYLACTPSGYEAGAAVIANDEVMILFTGREWVGQFVTNGHGGYNLFDRENEWIGYLVHTPDGSFNLHNLDHEWLLQLRLSR